MNPYRILVVDDDPNICEIVQAYCERDGFDCAFGLNGTEGRALLESHRPDLIVLDVLLASENGIDWCRKARARTNVPILFLSSREEDEVKILALSEGGDDYMTKPFSPGVLMAKIKALLRRAASGRSEQFLELPGPGLTLDYLTQTVTLADRGTIDLSKKEFSLLSYLAQNADRVVTADALYQLIWGADSLEDTRTIAVHISNLRRKLEADPGNPQLIVTVRGSGYMLTHRDWRPQGAMETSCRRRNGIHVVR